MVAYFVLLVVMTLVVMVGAAVVRVAGFVDIDHRCRPCSPSKP